MDPISLAFAFLMQNPAKAAAGAEHLARPGTVDISRMQSSFADLSREILNCYHRTARFQVADMVQRPWDRQSQYGASHSALIRIQYTGVSAAKYQMVVAVLAKDRTIRTAVLADNALVPYSRQCLLEQWTKADAP